MGVSSTGAAPLPPSPRSDTPPPPEPKSGQGTEAPKGEQPTAQAAREGQPEAQSASQTTESGEWQSFMAGEEGSSNLFGEALTDQQQMLQNLARSNVATLNQANIGGALSDRVQTSSEHIQQAKTDASLKNALDQASQQNQTEGRDIFQRGVSADQSTAMRAFGDKSALESGRRYADAKAGVEKGSRADLAGQKVAKQSAESNAQYQARMLQQSRPGEQAVNQRTQQLPNFSSLTPKQQQLVKQYQTKQMQMEKLQQMLQQAKAEGASKEEQQLLEGMLKKLQGDIENPDPETAAALKLAEEGGESKEKKEVKKGEEGKEAKEGEGTKDTAEKVGEKSQSDSESGGEGGQDLAKSSGDVIPANLTPLGKDFNLQEARESGQFGEVLSTGGQPSADGGLSIQHRFLGSIEGGRNPVQVATDSRGQMHFYRVRPMSERKRHPLDPIPLQPGQKDAKITREQNVAIPGEHFNVGGKIYNKYQILKEADQFAKSRPGQDSSHILLGNRRVLVEELEPDAAETMGIPSAAVRPEQLTAVSREEVDAVRKLTREVGIIRGYQLGPGSDIVFRSVRTVGHAPVSYA